MMAWREVLNRGPVSGLPQAGGREGGRERERERESEREREREVSV